MNSTPPPTRITGILCAALLLGACASPAQLTSSWPDDAHRGKSFKRIVVVGVTDDRFRRRGFEESVVATLTSRSTEAWASSDLMDPALELTEDTIDVAVKAQQADAVLITRLEGTQVQTKNVDSRVDVQAQPVGGNIVDIFRYDYTDEEDPGYLKAKFSITLSTNLYAADSGVLIYSIRSVTTEKNSDYNAVVFEVIENTSTEIARRVRRDGLAR